MQPNGRIIVAGLWRDVAALVGFRADGSVDTTFGTGGRTLLTGGLAWPSAIEVLSDGKLLVGGDEAGEALLARFTSSGVADATFGDGGLRRGLYRGSGRMSLVRQPDGKFVASGLGDVVVRFEPDGQLDPTFGTGGTASVEFGFGSMEPPSANRPPQALAVQPDGRILAGGTRFQSGRYRFAIVRLNPDGSQDASWPVVITNFHPENSYFREDIMRTLFLEPDGRILAVGDKVAARDRSDGSLDPGFGIDGRVDLSSSLRQGVGAFLGADGELVLAGGDLEFVLAVNRMPAAGRFHALPPARILDTRTGNGAVAGKVGTGATLRVQALGVGGVPSTGVSAVVLNLTATEPSSETFVTAWPANGTGPTAGLQSQSCRGPDAGQPRDRPCGALGGHQPVQRPRDRPPHRRRGRLVRGRQ